MLAYNFSSAEAGLELYMPSAKITNVYYYAHLFSGLLLLLLLTSFHLSSSIPIPPSLLVCGNLINIVFHSPYIHLSKANHHLLGIIRKSLPQSPPWFPWSHQMLLLRAEPWASPMINSIGCIKLELPSNFPQLSTKLSVVPCFIAHVSNGDKNRSCGTGLL